MDGDLIGGLPVYPLAALFPMLPDDELAELADDIKENGLIHPIMLDHQGEYLIDGRNRLRACEIAEVEPRFDRLPPDKDPDDYIASVNLSRRHMGLGQRAMALAMIYPKADNKGGRGKKLFSGETVSRARLSFARTILRVAPDDLAPLVLSGAKTLDEAYAEVKRREQIMISEEVQLARLRAEASDVADLVVEGTLSLTAGLAELDERARIKRITIEQGRRAAAEIVPTLEGHIAAMVAAGELGEFISLDKDHKARLRAAISLLKERGIG